MSEANRVDEVQSLREELLVYSQRVVDLTKYAVTATAALLALAVTAATPSGWRWFVALLPLALLVPAAVLTLNTNAQIARIATYLRTYYSTEYPYEARLQAFRRDPPRRWPRQFAGVLWSFLVAGWICITVSLVQLRPLLSSQPSVSAPLPGSALVLVSLAALLWLVMTIHLIGQSHEHQLGRGSLEAECEKRWKTVRGSTGGGAVREPSPSPVEPSDHRRSWSRQPRWHLRMRFLPRLRDPFWVAERSRWYG